jgi:hypothetical protein
MNLSEIFPWARTDTLQTRRFYQNNVQFRSGYSEAQDRLAVRAAVSVFHVGNRSI